MLKKRILVLGGQGYLGRNIAVDLAKDHELFISARNKNSDANPIGSKLIEGDYFSDGLLNSFYPFYGIIHAGSYLHPRTILTDSDYKNTFQKEMSLLESIRVEAKLGNLKKVLYISSAGEIYGSQTQKAHFEEANVNPLSQYGKFKADIEKAYLSKLSNICQVFIVRTSNPYGKFNGVVMKRNFINRSINLALNKKPIELWGNVTISRDFIYIDDFISAIRRMIFDLNLGTEVFNVGNGQSFSLGHVAKLIVSQISGASVIHTNVDYVPKISENVIDISKAKKYLDWEPSVTLESGIHSVINDIRKNNFQY